MSSLTVGLTIANGGITAGLEVFIFPTAVASTLCGKCAADSTQVNPLDLRPTHQRFYGARRNNLGRDSVC